MSEEFSSNTEIKTFRGIAPDELQRTLLERFSGLTINDSLARKVTGRQSHRLFCEYPIAGTDLHLSSVVKLAKPRLSYSLLRLLRDKSVYDYLETREDSIDCIPKQLGFNAHLGILHLSMIYSDIVDIQEHTNTYPLETLYAALVSIQKLHKAGVAHMGLYGSENMVFTKLFGGVKAFLLDFGASYIRDVTTGTFSFDKACMADLINLFILLQSAPTHTTDTASPLERYNLEGSVRERLVRLYTASDIEEPLSTSDVDNILLDLEAVLRSSPSHMSGTNTIISVASILEQGEVRRAFAQMEEVNKFLMELR